MDLEKEEKLVMLPKRPRGHYCETFKKLEVATNHFKVQLSQFDKIYIFSIVYEPQIALDNVTLRRKLLEQSRDQLKLVIHNPVISGNNIYSTSPPQAQNFQLAVADHRITFKKVKEIDLKQNPKLLLSFLNNGLRYVMRGLDYIEIGRTSKFFNPKQKTPIDSLLMFNGYRSNFVLLQNGYFLRVDSAKKLVRNQTVLEYIDTLYKIHQDKGREQRRNIVQSELGGKIVLANYGKTAYYKVQELVYQELHSVLLEDGLTTLKDYYEKRYHLKITNKSQPLLKVIKKRINSQQPPIWLVPEFCLMTGIPENFDQFRRKKISENTIKNAEEKQREILSLMKELRSNQDFKPLKELGISISQKLQTIKGRVIPMPKLALGENNAIEQGKEASFNLFNKPIFASKHSIRCAVIYFSGQDIRPLLDIIQSTARNLKAKFQYVKVGMGQFDSRRSIESIENAVRKGVERERCNFCLIFLPNQLRTQYKKVKYSALVQNKITCQVVVQNTLRKKNLQSIATKILLQIIAKRGNTLWVPKSLSNLTKVMMFAFQTAKTEANFTLAMCATINSTFSSIFSRTQAFSNIQAKFSLMVNLTLLGINAYTVKNKEVPAQVIIFNGTVPNDQIIMYQEYYIKPLKTKLEEIYKEKTVALTLAMITGRTAERFFTYDDRPVSNVPPGTIIASDVVSNFYDFYLVSQTSNRGSILPNHYKVIYCDSKMEEGILQELIFSQCFNYVNWTGSIKVPGIIQYASKCAKFSSQVLENKQLCDDIQRKLYFI